MRQALQDANSSGDAVASAADGPVFVRPVSKARRISHWFIRRLLLVAAILALLRVTGCMEKLFYQPTVGPTPPPSQFNGAELVEFASADGTRLSGWFLPASLSSRRPGDPTAPTVLHVHGNAGNIIDHVGFTEYLPFAGFNVLVFDYRGYGQSEGRAWTRGPLIADTHAALDYLLRRSDVDPIRIGMYGQSLGGAIGLNMMAARPEIRAAVIESSFSSWRDEVASVLGGGEPSGWARALAWLLISDGYRVDEALSRIDRPILLLHGDADTTVPATHSRRLKAAGGDNVRLVELPGGQHNTLRDSHPHVDREVIKFFRQHLFAEAPRQ